jgi:hypothetical protein
MTTNEHRSGFKSSIIAMAAASMLSALALVACSASDESMPLEREAAAPPAGSEENAGVEGAGIQAERVQAAAVEDKALPSQGETSDRPAAAAAPATDLGCFDSLSECDDAAADIISEGTFQSCECFLHPHCPIRAAIKLKCV